MAWLFGVIAASMAIPGTSAPADGFLKEAEWLRHPVFAAYTPLGIFERHDSKQKATELKNIHTYFRREITVPADITRAIVHVTADDHFKLYVNGEFVIEGPEPGYPFAHPYVSLDVTRFLREGRNCLAAHVYYHGVATRAFNSADNRAGFMLSLHTSSGGEETVFATDSSWKCFLSETFRSSHMFGYATQFDEDIDLRAEPVGWRDCGFDDSDWEKPLCGRQDHTFIPSEIPPLEHWRAEPVSVTKKEAGHYFYDFGQEIVGHTRIAVTGPAGHVTTVWHGEEMCAPDTVRHEMRCNCNYEEEVILSGGNDLIEFFDYKAFRYIEILNAPSKPSVWVDVRHYPLDLDAFSFDSSDEQLNQVWKICVEGVRMGCQGVFTDCPSREKGQYTGDTYMTVLSQLLLTADLRLARKAIRDFQRSQRFDDGMLCVAPGGFRQELAEWSLLWPVMLEYYYQITGDDALVKEMLEAGALKKLFGWFAGLESDRGLLTDVNKHKWVLVDWPENLRGGYDYDGTKDGENTVINAFYYQSLRSAAHLMRIAGESGDAYDQRADRLREAIVQYLLDPERGIFRDGSDSRNCSLHASGFPLCFGLVPEANLNQVIAVIRKRRLDCNIYGAPYFIEGCYKAGEHELAYDLMIRSRDKHSWYQMVASGATTTMEAWGPDLKWNTSWCHPAGATPIYLLITCMLGLQPGEPGWTTVRVNPQIPAGLEWINVRFPTVAGEIQVHYRKDSGYRLAVPEAIGVDIAPSPSVSIHVENP